MAQHGALRCIPRHGLGEGCAGGEGSMRGRGGAGHRAAAASSGARPCAPGGSGKGRLSSAGSLIHLHNGGGQRRLCYRPAPRAQGTNRAPCRPRPRAIFLSALAALLLALFLRVIKEAQLCAQVIMLPRCPWSCAAGGGCGRLPTLAPCPAAEVGGWQRGRPKA